MRDLVNGGISPDSVVGVGCIRRRWPGVDGVEWEVSVAGGGRERGRYLVVVAPADVLRLLMGKGARR